MCATDIENYTIAKLVYILHVKLKTNLPCIVLRENSNSHEFGIINNNYTRPLIILTRCDVFFFRPTNRDECVEIKLD